MTGEDNFWFEGTTNSELSDANDHLTLMLPKGKSFTISADNDKRIISIENEKLVEFKISE